MGELLTAVQGLLRAGLGPAVRAADVFLTPHPDFLPPGAQLPAVGVMDGPVTRREGAARTTEEEATVQIFVWSRSNDPARSLLDCLELAGTVRQAIVTAELPVSGWQWTACPRETESQLFADENLAAQRKGLEFVIIRETL